MLIFIYPVIAIYLRCYLSKALLFALLDLLIVFINSHMSLLPYFS